jgi:small ligand-binding sensory domain FIST
MQELRAAHAAKADWREAAATCLAALGEVPRDALGFLYVTDHLAGELSAILAVFREATGIEAWVGTAGIGIAANDGGGMAREYFDEPAIAVLVAPLAAGSWRVFDPVHGGLAPFRAAHGAWIDGRHPLFGIVHADPNNPLSSGIIAELAEATGTFLVGGLTCSRNQCPQIAERVVEGGVSGVLFAGGVSVATALSQGCSPIGPARRIDEAEGNVVKVLEGRPALEAFKTDAGDFLASGGAARSIHVALPVEGSDTGDYLVRNLMGIDPARGWIAIGDVVEPGDSLMFARRDREAATEDLRRMLASLGRRTTSGIKGGLYFSCVARGPNLFGPASEEVGLIREALGDFPLVGFFGNGEICNDRVYGYTGVLAVFL